MTKAEQVMAALDSLWVADGQVMGKLHALHEILAIDGMHEPATDEQILELAKQGLTYAEIQRMLHVDWRRVHRVAPGFGQRIVDPAIIRQYLDEGYSHTQIAKMLGVSTQRIRRLFPGSAWTPKQIAEYRKMQRELEKI
jgi:DNA-directed RNA polymerase specialized sigma24 family protein